MSEKKENKKEQTETPEDKQEESKQKLLVDMKNLLQRTQANFENYRKQTEKRIEDIRSMASRDIILQILPVLDNFELAMKSADANANNDDLLSGVELIYSQLFSVLENNGVSIIKKKEFDPFYHEALMKIDSKLPENTIVEELQKGFILHDKVIRHTKVKISSGICNEDKECKK
jgi:molecular chaperone GrpE (heat shock protein)